MIFICQCQSITEPKLSSIVSLNSTALNITWQFANNTYDQSDFIQITIQFIEFIYNFNYTYPNIIYTYSANNKTSTSLTKNFHLVNGFVYFCFSSNSTIINSSTNLFWKTCRLAQTCKRMSTSNCSSQASFVILSSSDITTNSFIITLHWLRYLPYIRNSQSSVNLLNTNIQGTLFSTNQNETFDGQLYQFSSLSSQTNYTVRVIVSYTIFDSLISETLYHSVVTSDSSSHLHASCFLWSILAFYLYLIK